VVRASGSLALRAVLAVVLLVGFYVLALALAIGLLLLPVAEVVYLNDLHPRLDLLCLVGALVILWSLRPRPDRFEPPGPLLDEARYPELFRELRAVAEATGQAMPREVYLVPEINGWVAQRGGVMGFGSRRVMGLGLPLMQLVTVPQLRAVLAHEFGHFHGGDTLLGPWIYRTRAAIGRTTGTLASARVAFLELLRVPFELYGRLFLRITQAISRAQEYAADALAARTQGARALMEGLRRIHGTATAFGPYWSQEVVPALESGFRPPIARGFARFIATERHATAIEEALQTALTEDRRDPYDSHPPLRERLAALERLDPGPSSHDDTPAIRLLGDLDAAELALLRTLVADAAAVDRLKPVPWEALATELYLPTWTERVRLHRDALEGLTPATIPVVPDDLVAFARDALGPRALGAHRSDLVGFAVGLLSCAIALLLVDEGFVLQTEPGEPIRCVRGNERVEVLETLLKRMRGELTDARWAEIVADLGIADRDLAGPDRATC